MQLIGFSGLSFTLVLIIFSATAIIVAIAGTWLSRYANQLADRTGIGEALTGAVLLGGITSLPGIIATVTAAVNNYPELAISNAIGGIAAQTSFLAVADIAYKKANLEHAAASLSNLMYCVLLCGLLISLILIAVTPETTVWHIHPGSFLLPLIYFYGLRLASFAEKSRMWSPKFTQETISDEPNEEYRKLSLPSLLLKFLLCALLVAVAGNLIARTGIEMANRTELSEAFVGAVFTAMVTSVPELVVSVAAVRNGALTLAVGNIMGGNCFDVLFIVIADLFYTEGSIMHAGSSSDIYLISLSILMTSVLLMGLLYRQEKGIAKIGWESFLILVIFLAGYFVLYFL